MVAPRPFVTPFVGARKLIAIMRADGIDTGQYAIFEDLFGRFIQAGGTPEEFEAAVRHAIYHGWLREDRAHRRLILLAAGRAQA